MNMNDLHAGVTKTPVNFHATVIKGFQQNSPS